MINRDYGSFFTDSQFIELLPKRITLRAERGADGLIVELKDSFAQLGPEREALTRQFHDQRTLVLRIGHPLDKPVALKGFMLPLKVEGGLVTELLIMRDQSMCCYGVQPKINEWVSVKMSRAGVKPIMDQPVTLFGKLHVGEMRENGYLVGIYSMDGDKMEAPE